MAEMQEKREYYGDRSLKAVYTVDGKKKHGKYTEYFENSDTVKIAANYDHGVLDGEYFEKRSDWPYSEVKRIYDKGIKKSETIGDTTKFFDKNEKVTRIESPHEQMDYKDGKPWNGKKGEMEYKEGQEWNGEHKERRGYHYDTDYALSYHVKEGKLHGPYSEYDYEANPTHITMANYKDGVLHGNYKETQGNTVKEGEYNEGKFSGTVKESHKTGWYNDGIHSKTSTYKDDALEHFIEKEVDKDGKETVFEEINANGACFKEGQQGEPSIYYTQKDGKKEGPFKEVDVKGWTRIEASYKAGKLDGEYKEFNSDGTVAVFKVYRNGEDVTPPQPQKEPVMNGERREYYEDRSLKAVYEVKDGKKNGKYVQYYRNSDQISIEAEYKDDVLDGKYKEGGKECVYEKGILREEKTSYWTRTFDEKGDLKHITSSNEDMEYKNGKEWEGTKTIGRGDRDGPIESETYSLKNGVKHGAYHYWYEDGTKINANYKDGVLDGPYEKETSTLTQRGSYKDGVFSGFINKTEYEGEWTANRIKIETHEQLLNGEVTLSEYKKTNRNGKLLAAKTIKNAPMNGACEETLEDGTKLTYTQKDGKKDGIYQEIDAKGWTRVEASYSEGKLSGFYTEFNSDGTIAKQKLYRDGVDITDKYAKLKKAASKNVSDEKGVVNSKQSKLKKAVYGVTIGKLPAKAPKEEVR